MSRILDVNGGEDQDLLVSTADTSDRVLGVFGLPGPAATAATAGSGGSGRGGGDGPSSSGAAPQSGIPVERGS